MIPHPIAAVPHLLRERVMRLFGMSWLVVLTWGCGDAMPLTTGDACGQSEVEIEIALGDGPRDVLLIIEPELARTIEPKLRTLLEGIVTGRADDDPQHRLRRDSEVRVVMLAPADAIALLEQLADPEQTPTFRFNRYRYAPYGYEEDAAAFVERVLCPLHAERGCEGTISTPEDAGANFEPFVITDRDACRDGELPPDGPIACDPELSKLIAALRDHRAVYNVNVIAGAPADRVTLEAHLSDSDWPAGVLRDSRMQGARGADICGGMAGLPVQAAPVLIEALANQYTPIGTLCSPDLRSVLTLSHCGFVDWVAPPWVERIGRDADGLATCEWRETLPAEGLITHCAQLAAFGRAADPIAIEDGREVCVIEQIGEAEARTDYGWYVPSSHELRSSWPADPAPEPLCAQLRVTMTGTPALSWPTTLTPRSRSTVRCRLATAAAAACD